jgi:hypothetical protein
MSYNISTKTYIAIPWVALGSKPSISAGEWGLKVGVHSELQLEPEIPKHSHKKA